MKVTEIIKRLNGISTPIGGVSWQPPQSDVEVAHRVLTVLEDRRVLYEPYQVELPAHCIASVLEIRQFLTDQLAAGGLGDELIGPLQAMRAACRKFLADMDRERLGERPWEFQDMMGPPGWAFNQALGELRGVVGIHLMQIAARYGLDVPDTLAAILPAIDEE